MKKLILFIAVIFCVGAIFSSCKKSYKCVCIETTTSDSTTYEVFARTQNEARVNCDEKGLNGLCELK